MNKLEERIIEELLDTIKRLKSDISVINEAYCELQDEYEALELALDAELGNQGKITRDNTTDRRI